MTEESNPNWRAFADFARLDRMAGGPDSHLKTVVHMTRHLEPEVRAWHAGVYVAVYNVPMYQALVQRFPTKEDAPRMYPWLEENWKKVILRRERRRPVGSPRKLADCLESYAKWIDLNFLQNVSEYDMLWDSLKTAKYYGRYSGMKLLETLRQMDLTTPIIPDIRAKGGWSPREGLALLLPEEEQLLIGDDHPSNLYLIERLASYAKDKLAQYYDLVLNSYEWQVMLCDVKQSIVGQRQYPGRSLDSEMTYATMAINNNLLLADYMFKARRELFPEWALAELQGWSGVREDLGPVYAKHGYMWTDSKFDYLKTTDLANPVLR